MRTVYEQSTADEPLQTRAQIREGEMEEHGLFTQQEQATGTCANEDEQNAVRCILISLISEVFIQ